MKIQMKKLTPAMAEEYLYYFDNIAFTDHEEWSACYCLESHLVKEEEEMLADKALRRAKAKELIENGTMQGYLLYDNDSVIGWCNAGDKMDYSPIITNEEYRTVELSGGLVKVLYCIDIAPDYRGKGIAHIVLDKICDDAGKEGFKYVEGYPFLDKKLEYQYHGPIHLYEKHGFKQYAQKTWFCIMQKAL